MKHWPTLALVIGGLAFVGYFQVVQPLQAATTAAAAREEPRPATEQKKAPARKEEREPMTFGGYPCRSDCAEDKAGYRWAANRRISDPDSCTGITAGFIEGCRVYAEQQAAAMPRD